MYIGITNLPTKKRCINLLIIQQSVRVYVSTYAHPLKYCQAFRCLPILWAKNITSFSFILHVFKVFFWPVLFYLNYLFISFTHFSVTLITSLLITMTSLYFLHIKSLLYATNMQTWICQLFLNIDNSVIYHVKVLYFMWVNLVNIFLWGFQLSKFHTLSLSQNHQNNHFLINASKTKVFSSIYGISYMLVVLLNGLIFTYS